jgi:hypothetical protein
MADRSEAEGPCRDFHATAARWKFLGNSGAPCSNLCKAEPNKSKKGTASRLRSRRGVSNVSREQHADQHPAGTSCHRCRQRCRDRGLRCRGSRNRRLGQAQRPRGRRPSGRQVAGASGRFRKFRTVGSSSDRGLWPARRAVSLDAKGPAGLRDEAPPRVSARRRAAARRRPAPECSGASHARRRGWQPAAAALASPSRQASSERVLSHGTARKSRRAWGGNLFSFPGREATISA